MYPIRVFDSVVRCDSASVTNIAPARRGGVEVAGWTVNRENWARFLAYPQRVWVLRLQGGEWRLRTSRARVGADVDSEAQHVKDT